LGLRGFSHVALTVTTEEAIRHSFSFSIPLDFGDEGFGVGGLGAEKGSLNNVHAADISDYSMPII
jgi:hypothetical protein